MGSNPLSLPCIMSGCAHRRRPESIRLDPLLRTLLKMQAPLRFQTTSLRGCRPWRLQTRLICGCQRAQRLSTVGLEIPPTQRTGRPVAVSTKEV